MTARTLIQSILLGINSLDDDIELIVLDNNDVAYRADFVETNKISDHTTQIFFAAEDKHID